MSLIQQSRTSFPHEEVRAARSGDSLQLVYRLDRSREIAVLHIAAFLQIPAHTLVQVWSENTETVELNRFERHTAAEQLRAACEYARSIIRALDLADSDDLVPEADELALIKAFLP